MYYTHLYGEIRKSIILLYMVFAGISVKKGLNAIKISPALEVLKCFVCIALTRI